MNQVYHNAFFAMNTRCSVVFPYTEHRLGERVFHDLKMEAVRIESKLSRFLPNSELSRINKQAYEKPVRPDDELFEILATCEKYHELTGGALDITLRPLMNYWNRQAEEKETDAGPSLQELFKHVGMNHLHIDDKRRTVSFDNEHIEIDLGGVGKGYTLNMMEELIRKRGIENAFISFGESSVLTMGHHPAGDHWKVSINNYQRPGNSIHEFAFNDGSISTSANFFLTDRGRLQNHRHVIDPFKGAPIEDCISVTAYNRSPLVAEMLSTAFLVSTGEQIQKTLKRMDDTTAVSVDYSTSSPQVKQFKNSNNNNFDEAIAWV